jgi:hypothetical protein
MFVVQKVVNSTIRPILGRFVKGGEENIQFDTSTSKTVHLKDLEFKEDTLNLLLAPFVPPQLITVESARLGSFQVDISWNGGTLYWNDIRIHLTSCALQPSPLHRGQDNGGETQDVIYGDGTDNNSAVEEENPMGWSLRSYSDQDLVESEALLASLRSSFSSPILGVQRKFDEITAGLVHKFSNFEVLAPPLKLSLNGQYSKRDGLDVSDLVVDLEGEVILKAHGIHLPGFGEDDLSHTTALSLQLTLTQGMILFAKDILARFSGHDQDSSSPPDSRLKCLGVEVQQISATIPGLQLHLYMECVRAQMMPADIRSCWTKLTLHDDQAVEIEDLQLKIALERCDKVLSQSLGDDEDMASVTIACSPFDDDKVFLFRSQPIPQPIATSSCVENYKTHQQSLNTRQIEVKMSCIRTTELVLTDWTEMLIAAQKIAQDFMLASGATNSGATFSVEVKIEHSLRAHVAPFPLVVAHSPSFFKGTGEFWSGKVRQVSLGAGPTIAEVRGLRVAGEDLKRISVDVGAALISDLDAIVELIAFLPEFDPDQPPMDIFVHIKQTKVRANRFYCRDVRASNLDIFTSHNGTCFTITAARAESKSTGAASFYGLRATAVQITINEGETPVRVSVATMEGVISNDDLKDIIMLTGRSALQEEEQQHKDEDDEEAEFVLNRDDVIRNYMHGEIRRDVSPVGVRKAKAFPKWKVTIRQSRMKLYMINRREHGHIELLVDLLKLRSMNDGTFIVNLERGECLDRIEESVWNKAVIIRGLAFQAKRGGHIQLRVGTSNSTKRFRTEDVTLSLDQCFLDYVEQFIATITEPHHAAEKEGHQDEDTVWLSSIQITPFKARVDYKPPKDPSHPVPLYMRYLPLRSAVLKVERFNAFDVTGGGDLAMKFVFHALGKSGQNLGRIIAGFKPIRTPANVFRNATELVLVPLSATGGLKDIIDQAKQAATRTAISVLELGPALNVRPVDANNTVSVHSNQPRNIKEGFVRAGRVLRQDVTTVVAFITGDRRNVDLFDLPVMVLRPFTAPLTEILNGLCNQLDRERYRRLSDKYR